MCNTFRYIVFIVFYGNHIFHQIHGESVDGSASGSSFQLGVLIPWTNEWELGEAMGAAVGVAIDEITTLGLLTGYTVDWEWKDTECEPLPGLQAALDLWEETDDLDAYIGGGCSSICEPVALVAAAWNLPYVSFGCTNDDLSNKATFPTFTRSVGTWVLLAPMVDQFADWFEWERIGIIATEESIMQVTSNAIKSLAEARGKTVFTESITSTYQDGVLIPAEIERQRDKLRIMKRNVRFIVALMYDHDMHTLLLSAYDENMMGGDYVFFVFDADLDTRISPSYRPARSLEVYHGVVTANLRKPITAEWDTFAQAVIVEFQTETKFTGYDILESTADVSEVDVHAGMLHDAILMWAYGVQRAIDAGNDVDNGLNITHEIINNVDFEGITGRVVTNSYGDRKPDYSIAIAQDGEWTELFTWYTFDERLVKTYQSGQGADYWEGIYWSSNTSEVPLGRPKCGWDNEFCKGLSSATKAAIAVPLVLIILMAVCAIIGWYFYKHLKFENELKAVMRWKVNWSELTKNKLAEQIVFSRAALKTSKTYSGLSDEATRPLYAEIADYKGRTVCIKRINKPSVNFSDRDILLEVKMTRDMKNDNVNPFVGACVDAPHVAILMEYASKGSIQDVIQNESINLNWDFRMSIASDVARGMDYIHHSPLRSHGHLTSGNCVIDSRWVCKVTDYGMGLFKRGALPSERCTTKEGTGELWTAPELLRMALRPLYGSQNGDVYSYGIILQELIMEDGPYCDVLKTMEPIEIVAKVKSTAKPEFRPCMPANACTNSWRTLTEDCWREEEVDRPTFTRILLMLRELNGGRPIDVIENMICMLEQHTEHLEELISDKRVDIEKEKSKVDTLLNNILPKHIASQLAKGDEVVPEQFDSVTIYFADIVGFANLVSQSEPYQVVAILNDLQSNYDEMTNIHDVVKVDTIGDSAMMVSGVPVKNGDAHAGEICAMALHVLNTVANYVMRHLPGQTLQLRIGVHTGPVVYGVVGLQAPRFCLFGDTVDVASSMQTSGMPLRIHISNATANILERLGEYQVDCRGVMNIKGKGEISTFWLLGKDGFMKVPDISKAT